MGPISRPSLVKRYLDGECETVWKAVNATRWEEPGFRASDECSDLIRF